MADRGLALVRLLQLVSPTLPTGSFSYSQGLEWAVEAGWVRNETDLGLWLADCLRRSLARADIPILKRMHTACGAGDLPGLDVCCDLLLACRESRELREEEGVRGRALGTLLSGLGLVDSDRWLKTLSRSQLAGFAFAARTWSIEERPAAMGYVWAWLENMVIAGVKIIPLGQTAGQRLLLKLGEFVPEVVGQGLVLTDDEIGAACPALALASSFHENQYTRLYRS